MKPTFNLQRQAVLSGHNAAVFALSPSDDPRFFLSGAGDGWVVRWDMEAPELGKLIARVDTQIFSLLHLPDYNQVVVGNMHGGIHWVDLLESQHNKNIAHHRKGVFRIIRIGEEVFTAGGDGVLTRWDIRDKRSLESIQLSQQSLRGLAYCPARREIAIGASDHNIYLLDAPTFQIRATIPKAHNHSVFCVQYSPNGQYLISGGRDALLNVWDATNLDLLSSQAAHLYTINDLAFHPEGTAFATASRDRSIKIWDATTFELRKVLNTIRDGGHINSVNALLWSANDNLLISGSDDRSILLWQHLS